MTERIWQVANHLLVAGLLVCAAWPVVEAARLIAPGWDGRYLLTAVALVTLEAMLVERWARQHGGSWGFWLLVGRAAELAVILLLLRLFQVARAAAGALGVSVVALILSLAAVARGGGPAPALDLPGGGLLTPEFIFAGLLLFWVWVLAGGFAAGLLGMEGDDALLRDPELGPVLAEEHVAARHSLRMRVFLLGGVVVVITAVLRADLSRLGVTWAPFSGGLWNLVLYFALGLFLLGQSRFAGLRRQWVRESVTVRPAMAWSWAGASLILFLLVAAVVSVLPTRYSLSLLEVLAGLVNLAGAALYYLSLLVIIPLGWLLRWLQSLARPGTPVEPADDLLRALPPVPTPLQTAAGPAAQAWNQSLAFWLLFLGIFGLSVYFLARSRPEVDDFVRRLAGAWPWLTARWRTLAAAGRWLQGEAARLVQAGRERLRPSGSARPAPWRYLSVRRLTARDRVRFYFQAMLRRGREAGYVRRPGETPHEYQQTLAQARPEAEADLRELTDEFVEAQYSQHTIPASAAEAARRRWESIRRALRGGRPQ